MFQRNWIWQRRRSPLPRSFLLDRWSGPELQPGSLLNGLSDHPARIVRRHLGTGRLPVYGYNLVILQLLLAVLNQIKEEMLMFIATIGDTLN